MTAPQLKPSPVHESSLRQALQRVEDRLRQQEQKRKQDAHHQRTLKLAREFASQGVRQRQLEWERQNRKRNMPRPPQKDQVTEPQSDVLPGIGTPASAKPAPASEPPKQSAGSVAQKTDRTIQDQNGQSLAKGNAKTGPTVSKVIPLTDTVQSLQDSGTAPKATHRNAQQEPKARSTTGGAPRRKFSILMPLVAWLILCSGVIGAVLSWTTLSNVQAGTMQINQAEPGLSMGLLLGFAYLATGVMGFAFFWVSSFIGNQLKEIRRLLFVQSIMSRQAEQNLP